MHIVKRMVFGAFVLTAAAYVWALMFLAAPEFASVSLEEVWIELVILPAYAVLLTSWFVLPLGTALGVLLPRLARHLHGTQRILIGAAVGAVVGVIVAILTMEVWLVSFLRYAASMIPFCAVWIGIWTYRMRDNSGAKDQRK